MCKYNSELISNDTEELFIETVQNHFNNVETFFSKHSDAKFISFDIENDNINMLKKYIDIKSYKSLPRENVNNR